MTCQETKALLPQYQEGALAEAKRRDAEAHLSSCPPCKAALAEATNLDPFLRGAVRTPEPPADFWSSQEAQILKAAGRQATRVRFRGRRILPYLWIMGIGLGVAAALLVAVGIYGMTGSNSGVMPPGQEIAKESPTPTEKDPLSSFSPRTSRRDAGAEKEVSPAPAPEDPRKLAFPREPFPADPPPSSEQTRPPAPPKVTVTAVLPGDPEHLDRLTNESIEVGLAETASERVMGLIKAADGRVNELKAALGAKNDSVAEDLATAYTMIVRQGIASILEDRQEDAQELVTARAVAKTYAGWTVKTLSSLEPQAQGSVKGAIREALVATREIAGR